MALIINTKAGRQQKKERTDRTDKNKEENCRFKLITPIIPLKFTHLDTPMEDRLWEGVEKQYPSV